MLFHTRRCARSLHEHSHECSPQVRFNTRCIGVNWDKQGLAIWSNVSQLVNGARTSKPLPFPRPTNSLCEVQTLFTHWITEEGSHSLQMNHGLDNITSVCLCDTLPTTGTQMVVNFLDFLVTILTEACQHHAI